MEFIECRVCGKLFNAKKNDLCPTCCEIENINIKKIYDYFESFEKLQNITFSMKTLSLATGVKIQEIERLYRLNKIKGYVGIIDFECKLCGENFKPTVKSGVFCKNCTARVEKVINELKEPDKYIDNQFILDKAKEIMKTKETEIEETDSAKKGMYLKDSSKSKCGFKKRKRY